MNYKATFQLLLVVSLLFFVQKSSAQADSVCVKTPDSLIKVQSPMKASIMSAVVPGLGQFYNKKYWKTPLVYVGIGTGAYFMKTNITQYNTLKSYYLARQEDVSLIYGDYTFMSDAMLIAEIEKFRKNSEYAVVATVIVYVLNIIDASVDAHLFYFDVSDDLSINIQPTINLFANNKPVIGGGVVFTF